MYLFLSDLSLFTAFLCNKGWKFGFTQRISRRKLLTQKLCPKPLIEPLLHFNDGWLDLPKVVCQIMFKYTWKFEFTLVVIHGFQINLLITAEQYVFHVHDLSAQFCQLLCDKVKSLFPIFLSCRHYHAGYFLSDRIYLSQYLLVQGRLDIVWFLGHKFCKFVDKNAIFKEFFNPLVCQFWIFEH